MVLGFRLTAAALALAAGCAPIATTDNAVVAAPDRPVAATPDDRLSRATVGGRALALVTKDGGCALELGTGVVPLGLAAPCGFLRPKAGEPAWVHDYGTYGAVVLVGGPAAAVGAADAGTGRTPADRCSDTGRAVLVIGGKVAVSAVKTSRLWFCPDSAPDEKYYHGIAHEQPFAARRPLG